MKKKYLLALPILLTLTSMTGCKKTEEKKQGNPIAGWDPVLEYEGDLDVFMYIYGQTGTWRDAGSDRYVASDIIDGSQALFFAAAREFKKIYPNININVISGNGTGYVPSYTDNFQSYIESHNQRPPHIIHHVSDVPYQLENGLIADFSKYTDNFPLYDYVSDDLLKYFNYGGFQAAVPYGVYPCGIYVNTHLIENIYMEEMPEPTAEEWTLDALDQIISNGVTGQNGGRAGAVRLYGDLNNFISPSIYRNYIDGKEVDLDTPETIKLLEMESNWAKNNTMFVPTSSVTDTKHPNNTEWDSWEVTEMFTTDFVKVQLDSPYSIGGVSQKAVLAGTEDHFDYYPYPAIDSDGELTLGAMFGALTIGNQCPLDATGKENCTEKQRQAEEAAAYFATFMVSDPRSIKAASEIEWTRGTETSSEVVKGAIKGLPVLSKLDENGQTYTLPSSAEGVTDEYETQLQYFFDNYPTFTDEKPGFAKVLEMYSEGDYIVCSGTYYPWNIPTATGGTQSVFEEWNKRYYYDAAAGSVTWVSSVRSQLSTWSDNINSVTERGWSYLEEQMRSYYQLPEDWDVRDRVV